ncbi:class I SAM-dependent methyltransferase [Amnibacterium sp. CER49]|uniref:class I SAM-dependent methyltransferase n=1 Tax=Amnibacterium sp. CER49 TaxID=3039161 RepID=UPI002449F0AC|nr:class I SAM-dependent methyltransferase [Amnibacterium sp. CER49]MDH2445279.1 class I SAM-dependent methyltransferase [Amnibacterium sp. CER49]
MPDRSRTFGAVAASYERFRPGYPDELVDAVLEYAARPIRTAFEIGAGTGKATRAFAARGVVVTASDPDEAMLAELRRHVGGPVETVVGAFEDVAMSRTFDLVLAAAALHWTRAEGRWERIAALLPDGGVLASFGGPTGLADPALEEAAQRARAPFVEDDGVRPPEGTTPGSPLGWPGNELLRTPLFTDVREVLLPRRLRMPAEEYLGLLSTISAYLVLPEEDREAALAAIRAVLPDTVDVTADLVLHLARRVR